MKEQRPSARAEGNRSQRVAGSLRSRELRRLNLWRTIIGVAIILIGLVGLLNNLGLTTLTTGQVIGVLFALGIIALGAWIIWNAQPSRRAPRNISVYFGDTVIGHQAWELHDLRIQSGLGDVRIDLTSATIPAREGTLHIWGWVGDVRILLPRDLDAKASGSIWAGSVSILGRRADGLFRDVEYTSPGFDEAVKRVSIDVNLGIGDILVKRVE